MAVLGSSPEMYLKENHPESNTIPTFRRDGKGEASLSLRNVSVPQTELPESTLGWPLLRRSDHMSEEALRKSEARNMSVVQWVMSLPNRFNSENQVDFGPKEETESHEIDTSAAESEIEGDSPQLIQFSGDKLLLGHESRNRRNENSVSLSQNELPLSKHGWPLLPIASLDSFKKSEAMKTSMFQLNKPAHSISESPRLPSDHLVSIETRNPSGKMNNENCLITPRHLVSELELLVRANSSGCRRFSYAELKLATNQFSSDNLIGEGGCSSVYRGCLPSGKSVAVKVLRPYKQAWTDFSLEVDIISSIKHNHITPLIGVCVENIHLISVYDFFPKGSLEENLHGRSGKSTLPWEVRFKVAVAVAEALEYLHSGCPRPVIHRDIKSSNILLTNELQPQLSDFGLAIWGFTDSPYAVHDDVVGTFGYMAPEYFMNGRVSDKIDVYAFGVVLLELLSGRKPIDGEVPKGQESLVKWAKHLLERGDAKALLDPELNRDLDDAQVQRIVLAARFCISQSARVRPKVSQILKLLRGQETAEVFVNSLVMDSKDSDYQDDDDLIFEFGCNKPSGFALLDADSAIISSTCAGKSSKRVHRLKLKDYLKEQQD
ncbi:hypothetical protein FNV43_RR11984 [Rhamnella rubrinervis]|uniref:Protein kinase domain-containing protein n=1 Tax=Rhamnella rubrinervis TaxID=2594499 RepID=A0A8K0H796_9ROSA|nr:hypothetical protein FNV43_RR11984 [Rhamnella rubrinervis]